MEESPLAHYRLSFSADDMRSVQVDAQIPITGGTIRMASWGHPYLPRGWATFVENLEITNTGGAPVAWSEDTGESWGAWNVEAADNETLNLRYTVKLTHDEFDWNQAGGEDSRPAVTGDALFLVTKALFIYSPNTAQNAEVEIRTPGNWIVSSPWRVKPGHSDTFLVHSWISLVNNALVVGDHHQSEFTDSGMTVTVAVENQLEADVPVFTDTLKKQLRAITEIFGESSEARYLVSIRSAKSDDGESFENSFNQVIRPGRVESRSIVWANTMSHELFHYWNGNHVLVGEEKDTIEWFGEGFTEYYASLTLLRTGLIDEQLWFKKIERYLSRDFITTRMWPEETLSLVEAGKDKHRNWLRVYGGGATFALVLDIKIRQATAGERGLDDVMRLMAQRVSQDGKRFRVEDILAAVNEVSGESFDALFESQVLGNNPWLDMESVLAGAGLVLNQFADEFYLSRNENASALQRKIYAGMTGIPAK